MKNKRKRLLRDRWNQLVIAMRGRTDKARSSLLCLQIAAKHAGITDVNGIKREEAIRLVERYLSSCGGPLPQTNLPPAPPVYVDDPSSGVWDRAKAHPEYARIRAVVKGQMGPYWGKPQLARIVNALLAVEIEQSKAPAELKPTMARRLLYSITSINGNMPQTLEPKSDRGESQPPVAQKEFFTSQRWRQLRYSVLLRDRNRCLACGASPETSGAIMQVDHIKPRSKYPELQWEIDNLQTLCEDCNMGKGAWDETDWRKVS